MKSRKAKGVGVNVAAMKKKLKVRFALAQKKLGKAEKDAEKYVKTNPKKAALIAAGIGAAVGAGITALLMRKRR